MSWGSASDRRGAGGVPFSGAPPGQGGRRAANKKTRRVVPPGGPLAGALRFAEAPAEQVGRRSANTRTGWLIRRGGPSADSPKKKTGATAGAMVPASSNSLTAKSDQPLRIPSKG